jgi:hypothetical protein
MVPTGDSDFFGAMLLTPVPDELPVSEAPLFVIGEPRLGLLSEDPFIAVRSEEYLELAEAAPLASPAAGPELCANALQGSDNTDANTIAYPVNRFMKNSNR